MAQDGTLRILVVEDHHDSCVALGRLLQRCGHEPHCFDRVEPAWTAVATGRFDIAICDVGLPDGDGCDLMRQLAAQYNIPCIAVTGHAEEEYATRVIAAGICLHLCKPIEFKQLLDAIEQCRPKADEAA